MIRSNTIKSLVTRYSQMSATTMRRLKAENRCVQVKRFSLRRTYCNGEKTKESINVRVSSDRTSVEIHWNDESKPASFHAVWLRWQCWCSECRDPELGQTLYCPGKLGYNYVVNDATQEGNDLVVKFNGDENHVSRLPLAWLKKNQYGEHVLNAYRENTQLQPLKPPSPVEYKDFNGNEKVLLQVMMELARNGAALIRNTPLEEGLSRSIGKRVSGQLFTECYGDIFDIKVDESINDFASRNYALPLHMDHIYHESPPLFLVMHCLAFDDCVEGGESNYLNVFYEAERFRILHPEDFNILTKVPTTYQRELNMDAKSGHYTITYHRPHFTVNYAGDLIGVGWATETHGPILADAHLVPAYYKAYSKFAKQIDTSPFKLTYRMKPGDVFIFNNRTLIHNRNAFQLNGGNRHFQGVSTMASHFRKTLFELASQHGINLPPLRIGDLDHNFRM